MGKKLVIVESPAKSKTIGRYLGSDYVITASLGHIRDLPSGNLGVDVKNNYKPLYINMYIQQQLLQLLLFPHRKRAQRKKVKSIGLCGHWELLLL